MNSDDKAVTNFDDSAFEINIQPDVSALRMFRSMSFTPWYAIGEFVDNSLTSALIHKKKLTQMNGADYKVRIDIDFPAGASELVIKDNAAGITQTDMQRALRMGKAPQDISIGLSRHGVGMKAAAFWWGGRLEIKTYPIGESHGWQTVLDVSEEGDMQGTAQVIPIPWRGFPGTEVRISKLWQRTPVGRTKGAIRAYLPSIYRAFLGGGAADDEIGCILNYEGKPLRYENPPLLTAPFWPTKNGPLENSQPAHWKDYFEKVLSTGKRVTGWYGILETMSRDKSGFFLHYRGKGIAGVVPVISAEELKTGHEAEGARDAIARASYKPRKIFGQVGMYPDQSFVGEFDVSDFGKTISTDAPLWSADEEAEFVEALFEHMTSGEQHNFIKMANNYRRRAAAREETREIEAKRVLEAERSGQALSGVVEHKAVGSLPPATYDVPPPSSISPGETSQEEGTTHTYTFNDRDGHTHAIQLSFISDRSADFISVYEERNEVEHTVTVNISHPFLDDIPVDSRTSILLERIAFSLASAEVLLTMLNKQQVRETMNEHLRLIGTEIINE